MGKSRKKYRAYDVKINYPRKIFGNKFVDYLSPNYFNVMTTDIKKIFILILEILKLQTLKKQLL